ncbi:MAG: FAD-binding oxidoreductase [Chloroflexi bacterium]|nr:FAD-binding oxidoreductase [Chloroflexota bacterium]
MKAYVKGLPPDTLDFLVSVVGEQNVSISDADLDQHSRDQSFHEAHLPAVVIWPASAQEISSVLSYANQKHIPVTPWGAGTSLEGNPIPVHGGIVIDTIRMDKIINVRVEDFQVDVEAGVRYRDLNELLASQGLFFAPDPGANASIGGMIANNAAGTRTPKYGATKDNVMRLEVVLASGEIIRTGTRASKTSSGYDLVHLFVGSEGTLGVITEATLKLAPLPDKLSAVITSFPTLEAATQTVTNIIGSGLVPAALEFISPATLHALNTSGEFKLPEDPTLLMEFHSATDADLKEELALVEELCKHQNCSNFESGLGLEERDRMWEVRHQAYEILVRSNPGISFLIVDVAVPISEYPKIVEVTNQVFSEHKLNGFMIGHAGDGNLHPLIPYTPGDMDSYSIAIAAEKEIVVAAIAMHGTATGEHGVGLGKRDFMEMEHGSSMAVMRTVKDSLDPNGILNPGKIFS